VIQYWCSGCGRPIGLMVDKDGYAKAFFCPRSKRVSEMIGYVGKLKPVEVASE
jgi:hypothetical protein